MVAYAKEGDAIEIWGDGNQTRSYLYINECLEGVDRLMNSDYHQPINIGSEEMISINDLANMAIEISGKKGLKINNVPGPEGVRGRCSDNLLIREILDWAPSMKLYDGMVELYKWIEQDIRQKGK